MVKHWFYIDYLYLYFSHSSSHSFGCSVFYAIRHPLSFSNYVLLTFSLILPIGFPNKMFNFINEIAFICTILMRCSDQMLGYSLCFTFPFLITFSNFQPNSVHASFLLFLNVHFLIGSSSPLTCFLIYIVYSYVSYIPLVHCVPIWYVPYFVLG